MYRQELLELEKEIEEANKSGDDQRLLTELEMLLKQESDLDQELKAIEVQEKQAE